MFLTWQKSAKKAIDCRRSCFCRGHPLNTTTQTKDHLEWVWWMTELHSKKKYNARRCCNIWLAGETSGNPDKCHKTGMTDRISKIVGFSGWASLFIGPLWPRRLTTKQIILYQTKNANQYWSELNIAFCKIRPRKNGDRKLSCSHNCLMEHGKFPLPTILL